MSLHKPFEHHESYIQEIFVKFALLNGNRYGYDKYFRLCGVLDW